MEENNDQGHQDFTHLSRLLERTNAVANTTQLDSMLVQMLSLCMDVSHAGGGICYLAGESTPLVARAALGLPSARLIPGTTLNGESYLACQCFLTGFPIERELWGTDVNALVDLNMLRGFTLHNTLVIPIPKKIYPDGVLQLFNLDTKTKDLVQLICDRMATEIQKLLMLQVNEERTRRLQSMVGFLGRLDPSLAPDQILSTIIEDASKVLNAEMSSLFLEEESGENLVLQISSRTEHLGGKQYRVPVGQGIIGYVVQTGETVLVRDTSHDDRHYKGLDNATHFKTRSLVAVPLIRRPIHLSNGRTISSERIIGGIEAINKIGGEFDAVDLSLLESFANQAATVLQISNLYHEADELFLDAVRALTAAIDAKDPYTKGHSQRVSDLSVAIANEMGMDTAFIHHIRIGSMLHDVGKIGISDRILRKPDGLTPDEYEEMKQHPLVGERMLHRVRTLSSELAAISEHHERLDGSGYPRGLKGNDISIIGRIVAVADAFDAMTSDRPYRKALSSEVAFKRLFAKADAKFDRSVIVALVKVYDSKSVEELFGPITHGKSETEQYEWVSGEIDHSSI
jgi:HD-GYP domain-containing protein (c-di-GMP phosphodiesterase class II)